VRCERSEAIPTEIAASLAPNKKPGLAMADIIRKTWMAGTRPAMTMGGGFVQGRGSAARPIGNSQ
jgi:hypothetical protein